MCKGVQVKQLCVKDPASSRDAALAGAWRIFSGNEIGILLAHWLWCCWRRDHMDDDPACVVMLASAVSSKMLQAMAQVLSSLQVCMLNCFAVLGLTAADAEYDPS